MPIIQTFTIRRQTCRRYMFNPCGISCTCTIMLHKELWTRVIGNVIRSAVARPLSCFVKVPLLEAGSLITVYPFLPTVVSVLPAIVWFDNAENQPAPSLTLHIPIAKLAGTSPCQSLCVTVSALRDYSRLLTQQQTDRCSLCLQTPSSYHLGLHT